MDELPKGWVPTQLGDVILKIIGGGTPSKAKADNFYGDIPFVTVKDFKCSRPQDTIDHINTTALKNSASELIDADTILLTVRMSIGKIARYPIPVAINQDVKALLLHDCVDKDFIELLLRASTEALVAKGTGTTVKGIRIDDIQKLQFNLPPLPEQRRIVAKLDSLLARSRRAREKLQRIPKLVERYKKAVLAAAFSGELTREWRENKNHNEPWKRSTIGNVLESIRYGTSKKCGYHLGPTPVLRIPNIGDGVIDHTDIKYSSFDKREAEQLRLKRGDILIIRSNGSADLVGKAAIVSEREVGFLYAGYLIRLRPLQDMIYPTFLLYFLQSAASRNQIETLSKSTSGVNNINTQELSSIEISVPAIEEQVEIVNQIENRFAAMSASFNQCLSASSLLNRLEQQTLAKAFRGELVSQDQNDESAIELLKKIQSHKSQVSSTRGIATKEVGN